MHLPALLFQGPKGAVRGELAWLAALLLTAMLAAGCGGSIDADMDEARTLLQVGDFGSSIAMLRGVLAREPDHPEANYLLGVAMLQTGQPGLAVLPLRKAGEDIDHAGPAGVLLAATLIETEAFEEAIRATDRVLEFEPERLAALQLRAQAHLRMGDPAAALADSERIVELQPADPVGLTARAMALSRLKRLEEAEWVYQQIWKLGQAEEDPTAAVRGCVGLANFYAEYVEEKAEAAVEECLEGYPDVLLSVQAAARYFDGVGQSERANEIWRDAVESRPDDHPLRSTLVGRLARQGEMDGALQLGKENAELFDDARAWSELAGLYSIREEYALADEANDRAIERAGGGTDLLRFRKADLLISLGQYDAAAQLASEIEQPVYRNLIDGRLLLARGQPEEALLAMEAELIRWPRNAGARYLAGQAAEELGDTGKALSHYREAVRSDPTATDAALAAARLHMAVGECAEAIPFSARQISNRPVVSGDAHRILARCQIATGNFDAARHTLKDMAKRDPGRGEVPVELAALERASSGPAAAARVIVGSGLDLTDPANALALNSLVSDLLVLGQAERALARVAAYEDANPGDAFAADLRGRVLLFAGRRDEARAAFQEAVARDPKRVTAYVALAKLAIADGSLDQALDLADHAAEVAPEDAEAVYLAAKLREVEGRHEEAISMLRENTARHPGHAPSANDLAWMLAERGEDLELAQALARRGARLSPTPDYLDTLGWVYFKQGDAASALEAYERALRQNPAASSVRYRMGLALESLGRSEEALQAFKEALGTGTFPEAEAARAQVALLEGQRVGAE